MNTPFKKRTNPLAHEEQISVEPAEEPVVVEPTPVQAAPQPKPQPKKQPKDLNPVREKYTAVMDKQLRRRVRVASITLDMDYSTFIEEAVRAYLQMKGF